MKFAGFVIAAAVITALMSNTAFAESFPFWQSWHQGRGHASPAPLLAAGIPAFVALGGAATIAGLTRRFRRNK